MLNLVNQDVQSTAKSGSLLKVQKITICFVQSKVCCDSVMQWFNSVLGI